MGREMFKVKLGSSKQNWKYWVITDIINMRMNIQISRRCAWFVKLLCLIMLQQTCKWKKRNLQRKRNVGDPVVISITCACLVCVYCYIWLNERSMRWKSDWHQKHCLCGLHFSVLVFCDGLVVSDGSPSTKHGGTFF